MSAVSIRSDASLVLTVLAVRLALLGFCVLSDWLVPDHEAEGVERLSYIFTSPLSQVLLRPFLRWDSIHYLNIALTGYQQDFQYVFFPLFPFCLRWMGAIANSLLPLDWQPFELITFSAVFLVQPCLNAVSALLLKKTLTRLGCAVSTINLACHYFIFNPAAIFFLALYTESWYAVLCWSAFYLLLTYPALPLAALPLCLASATRSNGIFNTVVVVVMFAQDIYLHGRHKSVWLWSSATVCVGLNMLACMVPYLWINYTAFRGICDDLEPLPQHAELCSSGVIWSTYAHLQQQYWTVGFLRQYQWRQLPNFLIASPLPYFLCRYFVSEFKPALVTTSKSMGLWLHVAVLTVVVLCMAHVQIVHRTLLSASPLTYLVLAQLSEKHISRFVDVYVVGYMVMGMFLHCNFFPWT